MKKPSVPLLPLERLVRIQADLPEHSVGSATGTWNNQVFGDLIGCSARAITRWRAEVREDRPEVVGGWIPWLSADVASNRIGLHPFEIWGQDWLEMDADVINEGKYAKEIDAALRKIGRKMAKAGSG